ncbi:hypothetical protein BZZ01_16060 [Nostocales cyanobacterium HT-58-2]|nr:hypothetical protein BZZ01_16060 [Nostocales cyanobacterium HT-58-2]
MTTTHLAIIMKIAVLMRDALLKSACDRLQQSLYYVLAQEIHSFLQPNFILKEELSKCQQQL